MSITREDFLPTIYDKYDNRLLERRLIIEGNVCGCLLKNLDLCEECDIVIEDFVTNHGKLLFLIINKLKLKRVQKFDEIAFMSALEDEFVKIVETALGGYDQIHNLIELVNLNNWDAFLDEFYKSNLLLKLYSKGFSLFEPMVLDNGKSVVPFNFFKELNSNEVLEFYEGVVASLQVKNNNSKLVEEGYIDFDDEWLESLRRREEMGVSYGEAGYDIDGEEIRTFPFMSNNTLGLKPGTLSAWGSYIGNGKTTYMVTTAMSLASKGETIVMVTNESRLSELNVIFLTWVLYRVFKYTKLTKRALMNGQYTDEDMLILKKAQKYWKENYSKKIKIETLSDADSGFSCQLIKRAILREGASVFILDTMKMTISDNINDYSWVAMIRDVRNLTEIAMKYNVIGLITIQLAMATNNRAWLDGSCLANCKQIKETLSTLVLFRKVREVELDPESPFYIHPFRRKKKTDGSDEWYDEPYDADPTKTYIVAFVDKNRRGTDSGMDGTAFLCRTDLDHASFFETARCHPTQKSFNSDDRR